MGHNIDPDSKNVLHPLLERDQIKQRESARPAEVKEDIGIGCITRLIACYRAENIEGANTRIMKFLFMTL